jgi:hypothetical protein
MSVPAPTGRPTVAEVALLIRARTKDSAGTEVGTFTPDTRPTDTEAEAQIDAAVALVGTRLPPLAKIAVELLPAVASVVAYRAALRIEKSYFPEQVRSDRSAYPQLYQEYLDDLAALLESVKAGGPEMEAASQIGMIPVGSWTSIPMTPPDLVP